MNSAFKLRILLLILLPGLYLAVNAQVYTEVKKVNLGKMVQGQNQKFELAFGNETAQPVTLTPFSIDPGITIGTGGSMAPGGYLVLNMEVHPERGGSFGKKISFHIKGQNQPITLHLVGKVVRASSKSYSNDDCPDFSNKKNKHKKYKSSFVASSALIRSLQPIPLVTTQVDKNQLDPWKYRPNHLTLVIDASLSMQNDQKLDVFRSSMNVLLDELRANDHISVVQYSSEPRVLLESVSASEKDSIIAVIAGIKTKGYTNGAKAIDKAYEVAVQRYISQGNNMVLVVTDGAFNIGKQAGEMTRDMGDHPVNFTILGIKCTSDAKKSMKKIASENQGRFLTANDDKETKKKLKKEIMQQSKI